MPLTRIGVFYDGNYFLHVSNYYNYDHPRRRRLSIEGLHQFIENRVAREEDDPPPHAKIVDAHYFRGRLNALEAQERGPVLYYDRVFDDILMSSGITTHYSPLRGGTNGQRRHEKGIDVWFALECYEQAHLRRLDVVVLIASDGDYVPLVRKLNSLGCRVMVLGWDFEFTTDNGNQMVTRTSQDLMKEASYPVPMSHVINEPKEGEELFIDNLFVETRADKEGSSEDSASPTPPTTPATAPAKAEPKEITYEEPTEGQVGDVLESRIFSLKKGYGFIQYPPNNLFFHHTNVANADFRDLRVDDHVDFVLEHNDKGQLVALDVHLIEDFEEE